MKRQTLLFFPLFLACGRTSAESSTVRTYATNLRANYQDVVTEIEALKVAVDAFVAVPTGDGLQAAQTAWLATRPPYGECETSRFYGGPIDQAQGVMNEWPIDENFIDYTAGNPQGGIINDTHNYPEITAEVLAVADQKGGIENLSTGFHAIEFLLWGQRLAQTEGPGQRPYTDYLDGGTATHQARRRTYLKTVTAMLLADMKGLTAAWDLTSATSYGSKFVAADSHQSLTKMLRGMSNLAIAELYYERMSDPYRTKDRKDEESCFSEATLSDLIGNALGVEDVYLGRYVNLEGKTLSGTSMSDLVKAKNPSLDMQMRQQITAVRDAIAAIPPPFDHAVLAPEESDAHQKVKAALDAFSPLQTTLHSIAETLGVTINL